MTDSSLDMSNASLLSSTQQLDDSQYTEDSNTSSMLSSLPSIPSLPPIDVDTRVLQQDTRSTSTSSPRSSLSSSYNRDAYTREGSSLPSPRHAHTIDPSLPPDDESDNTDKKLPTRPPLRQLMWGHVRSFSFMLGRFMFKDNNLPLILNVIGHLLAARQLWGKSKGSVARYTNIQQQQQQQQGSVYGTATLVADQFKGIGILHLSLGLLAALALKERRLSTERTALWVLSVAAWSQSFVQGKAYLQSPSLYTLKALQEWGALNGILTVITTIALRNTVRRTGRVF